MMATSRKSPATEAQFCVIIDLVGGQRRFMRRGKFDHKEPAEVWTGCIRDEELQIIDVHRKEAVESFRGAWVSFVDAATHAVGSYRADKVVAVTVEIVTVPPPKE